MAARSPGAGNIRKHSVRVKRNALTLRDVEYIIEKASFGIIKLELDDYEY